MARISFISGIWNSSEASRIISRAEALQLLRKDDNERRKWSKYLYGTNTWDSSLYDLVIHVHKVAVKDAVDIICHTASLNVFQATPESKKAIEDLTLMAEVKAAIIGMDHGIKISAKDGIVFIKTGATFQQRQPLNRDIEQIVKKIQGVKDVRIHFEPTLFNE